MTKRTLSDARNALACAWISFCGSAATLVLAAALVALVAFQGVMRWITERSYHAYVALVLFALSVSLVRDVAVRSWEGMVDIFRQLEEVASSMLCREFWDSWRRK